MWVAAQKMGTGADRRRPRRSRLYLSTDSGTIAEMDARSEPGLNDPFEQAIDDALSSLPADLRAAMSNVEIVVEDEPPDGQPLLGLYRGVPLPRRSSTYSGVLPDKISIFRGPITRLAAGDADRLGREVRHVVLHEIAHHFGISGQPVSKLQEHQPQIGLHRDRRATNPSIEIPCEGRKEHRIMQQRIHPTQLDRQHQQLRRQNRVPQRRLVTYSSEHDGLDPF